MALVVGAPVLISVCLRLLDALGAPVFRVNGITMAGPAIFGLMIWVFYLRFTVPVLGVFYGTSLIADEVEDKTITYLFTRPIPKGAGPGGEVLRLPGLHALRRPALRRHRLPVDRADAGEPGRVVPGPVEGPRAPDHRAGGLRGGVRVHRGPVQAAPPGRADLHLRLGAGRPGVPGLPQEVHGGLLPPGDGAARHAERHRGEPHPGDLPGESVPAGEPRVAERDFVSVFVGGGCKC